MPDPTPATSRTPQDRMLTSRQERTGRGAEARLPRGPGLPSLVILWASGYHLLWGLVLIFLPVAPLFTASSGLRQMLPNQYLRAAFLIGAAALAVWGDSRFRDGQRVRRFLAAMPQQLVLMLSAVVVVNAVVLQRYPDGAARPWDFILLDQLPLVLGALMYTVAISWPALVLAFRRAPRP